MTRPMTHPMPSGVHETLWHFFKDGPIWDGDLICKTSRTWLVNEGLADRAEGFNFLTAAGVSMAVSLDMNRRKEKERRP
jgi:hypothetical protein